MGAHQFENAILYVGKGLETSASFPHVKENDLLVGIDRGAYLLAKAGRDMDYAIGDFDSTPEEGMDLIKKHAKLILTLPKEKDDSDAAYACSLFARKAKSVELLGAVEGSRVEHLLANVCLLRRFDNLKIIGKYSLLFSEKCSQNPILLQGRNFYWSFFAMEESVLSLEGFRYPLSDYHLAPFDPLCLSNELLGEEGKVLLKSGRILIVRTAKEANSIF